MNFDRKEVIQRNFTRFIQKAIKTQTYRGKNVDSYCVKEKYLNGFLE